MTEVEIIEWLVVGFIFGALVATLFWATWAYDAMNPAQRGIDFEDSQRGGL